MKLQFSYPGGKARIADEIVSHFPTDCELYVEPFAGRGNIFFTACSHIDFNRAILNDRYTYKFLEALRDTPITSLPRTISIEDFPHWKYRWQRSDPIAYLLEPYLTFKSKGYLAGPEIDQGHNRYTYSNFVEKMQLARELLKNVLILSKHWRDLAYHSYPDNTFLYLDPPYHETDGVGYVCDVDHNELLRFLRSTHFSWILSGYKTFLYSMELGEPDIIIPRNREMTTDAGSQVEECLWIRL